MCEKLNKSNSDYQSSKNNASQSELFETKQAHKSIQWDDIEAVKRAEFRMLFYSSIRQIRRLERKLMQMAEAYKYFEEKYKLKERTENEKNNPYSGPYVDAT